MTTPLIVIQARMGSSRLSGKVMLPLGNTNVISLLIKRLKKIADAKKIIVATTNQAVDDVLCNYLLSENIAVFRGSEDDVLSRFHQCVATFKNSDIIRVTADCPLIDTNVIGKLIKIHASTQSDYSYLSPKFAEGLDVEIFTASALQQAYDNAKLLSEREHVTLYFHNNPEMFKITTLDQKYDHSRFRFTLDTIEDYEVLVKMSNFFGDKFETIKTKTIIDFLINNPAVYRLNCDIIRNEGLLISLNKDQEIYE